MLYFLTTNKGVDFIVDPDVWEWGLSQKWYLKNGYPCFWQKGTGYGTKDYRDVYLHRQLCEIPNADVHHRDGNPLNCTRANLESLTRKEHRQIHGPSLSAQEKSYQSKGRASSGYKGVSWHKRQRRWSAQIVIDGKNRTLGHFATAEEAARAYDQAVLTHRPAGSFLNFPMNPQPSLPTHP